MGSPMSRLQETTAEVARARKYAARVRILIAAVGFLILLIEPGWIDHAGAAAIGLGVIAVTGLIELLVRHERWLVYEETFSCVAAIFIVALPGGEITAITFLWLVAAAVGVLARGGRVGAPGRILVVGALLWPLLADGVTGERIGLAAGSILMLMAVGRISKETAELLEQARHSARHDDLTNLLERTAFAHQVDELIALPGPRAGAMIVIDIDDFGAVNKRHGHSAGDALLIRVSRMLQEALREGDVLARVGGDEFAAFVLGGDPEMVAERLVAQAGNAVGQMTPGARAGWTRFPLDGSRAEALLAGADVALRIAKRAAGPRVAIPYEGAPLTDGVSGARSELERLCAGQGLRIAVQPIVDVDGGQVHAYEALARFETGGGQGPLHWFSLAEEFGMRADLELICLRRACELLADLPGDTRLSVNLSAPLLVDARTVQAFAEIPDLSRLIVEVTEETLVRNVLDVQRVTSALRGRGVEFAVDDIGAGYSGLGQLATLRPSYLKLDRALVSGINERPALQSLLQVLTGYAASTGGMLVAEGVETEAELAVVRAAGAPLVQGFLLARPGPPWPTAELPDRVTWIGRPSSGQSQVDLAGAERGERTVDPAHEQVAPIVDPRPGPGPAAPLGPTLPAELPPR